MRASASNAPSGRFLEHARDPEAASLQGAQPTRSVRGRFDGTMHETGASRRIACGITELRP
jgi:hypothetical protein